MSPIKNILYCLTALVMSQAAYAGAPGPIPTMPFNNLSDGPGPGSAVQSNQWLAVATNVGSADLIINSFVVNVKELIHDASVPLVVQMCADKGGLPDLTACKTFSTTTNPMPAEFANVAFTGSYNAAAHSTVWIVLAAGDLQHYGWGNSASNSWRLSYSSDLGATWQLYGPGELLYSVSGIPVGGPTASAVTIAGTPQVGSTLTGSYTYSNTSGAAQGNTTVRWMSGTQADGSDKRAISGANAATYSPMAADGGNYLFYCVTPVAQTGTVGAEVCSSGSQFVLVSNITTPTTASGIGPNQVAPLDLSTGYGPSLTQCLMSTLKQLLGTDAVYLGQVSGGGTRVQQGGKVISFYVVRAGGDASKGSGLQLLQSNAMTVGTSCGNLGVTPALYNPAEFGSVLTAAGLTASINTQGVITISGNGSVYVARPDYFVTPGQAAGPSLKLGSDGQYRFTDSAGNSQVLRAAFLSPDALQADAGAALGGNLVIQIDGTALFTQFSGPHSVLSPDLVLGGIPASSATATWWTDGPNHYRFPIGFASQGLTQTAR